MGIAYNPKIVTEGLVLCLDAANPKSYPGSGTTWFDLSGNNHNATLIGNNSTVVYSSSGYFDHTPLLYFGAADSVSTSSTSNGAYWTVAHTTALSPNSTKAWTVSGFLNIKGSQSGNGCGWFHKRGLSDERGIHLEPTGTTFRINGASGWSNPNISVSSYHNTFAYYTFTYSTTGTYGTSTGTLKAYINDQLVATSTSFIPVIDTTSSISLGRRDGHLYHYLNGQIVNYNYYVKELSEAEVKRNFQAIRGRFGV